MTKRSIGTALVLLAAASAAQAQVMAAHATAPVAEHGDPVAPILLCLAVMIAAAKLGGSLFLRWGQPAVLGELVGGVVLGNILLLGGLTPTAAVTAGGLPAAWAQFVQAATEAGTPLDILARLGLVLLLFIVGLECDLRALLRVGGRACAAAVLGVGASGVLGALVAHAAWPGQHEPLAEVFIGAALGATSVGIAARVLRELKQSGRPETSFVLGTAVIDDILGLVVLAVMVAIVTARAAGTAPAANQVAGLVTGALLFLFVAVAGGVWLAPLAFAVTARLKGEGVLLATALVICFVLAGLAGAAGLAPLIGAFGAGLLLDEVHYVEFQRHHGIEHRLEDLVQPLAEFLVPLFFVQMGMTVRLEALAHVDILFFALLLTGAAVLGKQACALASGRALDSRIVAWGMTPRGEVQLIFAAVGHHLLLAGRPLLDDGAEAALVVVVMATTLLTPGLLAKAVRNAPEYIAPET
jgi:Kef-type K+ transport system membrane component KefB